MKILMLGWELPPFNSGGLGVACYHLCRHLANLGIAIDFVMPYKLPGEQPGFMQIHSAQDASVSEVDPFGAYDSWSADLQAQQQHYRRKVEQLVAKNNYDAIHAHDWLTFQAGVYAKNVTGLPLIAHVHSTEFDRSGQHGGNPIVHDIEYNCLLLADRIVAVSQATKSMLINKYNLPAQKIDIAYNATDPALFSQAELENTYIYVQRMKRLGYRIVVSMARLTVQKGMSYLLTAAQQALQLDSKLLFIIVGDGEQRDELVQLSAELGISEHIIFTGFVRGKRWRQAYEVADMFVMSSVSEPFGLTALEAASIGKAVLITKQSGASEVIPSALRFDFWDTQRLADYIVNTAQQPVLRKALAEHAQSEVRNMSWGNTASKIVTLYRQTTGIAL